MEGGQEAAQAKSHPYWQAKQNLQWLKPSHVTDFLSGADKSPELRNELDYLLLHAVVEKRMQENKGNFVAGSPDAYWNDQAKIYWSQKKIRITDDQRQLPKAGYADFFSFVDYLFG